MRVTSKMMTNTMLHNINLNKNAMSKLEEQYASGKKVQRPSDDPIIAVRALKLRTNLAELNQFYDKNIPDAMSWMDISESALKGINSIMTEVHTYCVQGANDPLNEEDRKSISANLSQLKQQIYQEGNTNYAGRYVFTGYKTDISLVFGENTDHLDYTMTECLSGRHIDILKRTIHDTDITAYDKEAPDNAVFDDKPSILSAYRMRLAYNGLKNAQDGQEPLIQFPVLDEDGNYQYDEEDGALVLEDYAGTIVQMNSTDVGAYEPEEDEIYFLEDTGEMILGSAVYEEFKNRADIRITYQKNQFSKNDLRPEHYFDCTVANLNAPEEEPVVYTKQNQEIQYEINFNQRLVINSQGSDAVRHAIGRVIDELVDVVDGVIQTQVKIDDTKKMMEERDLTTEQKAKLQEMLDLLATEFTLKTEVMQNTFESALTSVEEQQDAANTALADLGSRYVRLQLTESRLSTEQVNFEDLLSSNEDADLVDTIIRFKSQETVYNASLSAAAQVVKSSLLDFL